MLVTFSCVAGCKVVEDSADAGLAILPFVVLSSSSSESWSSSSSSSDSSSSSESEEESEAHFTSSSCEVAAAPGWVGYG